MALTTDDIRVAREHALHMHSAWKQEILMSDMIANDRWQIMWPDKTVETSEPLVENLYGQALEDKTLSAGALPPGLFTMPARGTRVDRAEQNAAQRKRAMLSYWDRSHLRKNLKRFYRDWYHTGATYGIPWTNWDDNPAQRFPKFLLLNPRQVFPLGHDSSGQLVEGLVMRQRRVADLLGDWGDHPTLAALIDDHDVRGGKAEFFEEIWHFDGTHWAVAIADSQLPTEWQGSPFVPGAVQGSTGMVIDWLQPPAEHKLDSCPLKEARRVTVDDVPRGALVDIIPGLKVAQNFMAALLDDLQSTVYAPVVLDNIENSEDYGLGAVLIGDGTGTAAVVRDRPPVNFEAQQTVRDILERTRNQAFEPAQRAGDAGASIVSAKGTLALMGSFNAELAAAQFDIEVLLTELTSATANLDEMWAFGTKHIWGVDDNSKAFDEKYDAATTFKGDYRCKVTYGDRTGLDEQNHLVRLATIRNLGGISLRTFMEKAGITEDTLAEETDMAIEQLTQLFMGQVLPQQIQGGDVTALQKFVEKIDDDSMSVRAAVMETIREMTAVIPEGGPEGGAATPGGRADILRMVRSLDKGGIPGNAEGQPPSQVALAPAVRRGLAEISPGGN